MPKGYPFPFNEEIFSSILYEISVCTLSIKRILSEKTEYPCEKVWNQWLAEDIERRKRYARAKEEQADILVDEMLEIADNANADVIIDEEGKMSVDGNIVQRDRLRIDTRKFIAMKLKPKKYGEKIEVEMTDLTLTPEDRLKRLQALKDKLNSLTHSE